MRLQAPLSVPASLVGSRFLHSGVADAPKREAEVVSDVGFELSIANVLGMQSCSGDVLGGVLVD